MKATRARGFLRTSWSGLLLVAALLSACNWLWPEIEARRWNDGGQRRDAAQCPLGDPCEAVCQRGVTCTPITTCGVRCSWPFEGESCSNGYVHDDLAGDCYRVGGLCGPDDVACGSCYGYCALEECTTGASIGSLVVRFCQNPSDGSVPKYDVAVTKDSGMGCPPSYCDLYGTCDCAAGCYLDDKYVHGCVPDRLDFGIRKADFYGT